MTTDEFIALAERVSGRQLDTFFTTWLFTAAKPPGYPDAPQPEVTASATAGGFAPMAPAGRK